MAELQTNLSNINFMSKERFDSLETIDDGQLYAVEFPFTDEDLVHTYNDEEINGVKTFNDEIYAPNQVDYTQITNCITEIPQDIKLELVDGTLTLKAGSKVYVPNGSGVFDVVNITSDKVLFVQSAFGTEKGLIFYNRSSSDIVPFERCFSGSTQPTFTGNTNFWYDTANNKIKYTEDKGSSFLAEDVSLPLGICSFDNGTIISIDQVFNGFGYIGSTVFALPGVKRLSPNGLNSDGTYKNSENTITSVMTKTFTTAKTNVDFILQNGNMYNGDNIIIVSNTGDIPSTGVGNYYVIATNQMLWADNGKNTVIASRIAAGKVTTEAGGVITSFKPKLPFRAVDYNDFNELNDKVIELDSQNVKVIGDQTIEGAKTFYSSASSSALTQSTGSTTAGAYVDFIQNINGDRRGTIRTTYNSDGSYTTVLGSNGPDASAPNGISVTRNSDRIITKAYTPLAGSNNTEIATTNWCYDPTKSTNLVHRTGDETIAGTKTFSDTIQGTAYRALWGDLAEYYETDKEYPRGTLVQFGGEKEITIASDNVNAVITSEPGFILNTQQSFNAENSQAIALVGKVPVRAIGKVKKFDYLTLSDIPGVAKVWSAIEIPNANVIARALESKNTEGEGLVFCTVKFEL